jgi:hypothetical protein
MLPFDEIQTLAKPIEDYYHKLVEYAYKVMLRRIAKLQFGSAGWIVQRMIESGTLYDKIRAYLRMNMSLEEAIIEKVFNTLAVKNIQYDNEVYEEWGMPMMPFPMNEAMTQVLHVNMSRTLGTLRNLALSTAIQQQNSFFKATDLAHSAIVAGVVPYDEAIIDAKKSIAKEGVKVIHYPSGHKDHVDVAVRRAVLTGLGQTAGYLTLEQMVEMGVGHVEVSAHIGARDKGDLPENHEMWQGKVYALDPSDTEYPNFYEWTGFGTGEGLLGWNCRHTFNPFFVGFSPRNYDQDTLDDYADREVEYNGEKLSYYEATQVQRKYERTIRMYKRIAQNNGLAGVNNEKQYQKIRQYQALLRDFVRQTGIPRQPEREQIIGEIPRVKD